MRHWQEAGNIGVESFRVSFTKVCLSLSWKWMRHSFVVTALRIHRSVPATEIFAVMDAVILGLTRAS